VTTTTVTVLIGNTDDKLSQIKWSDFCKKLLQSAKSYGTIQFSGGPPTDTVWQNFCVVGEFPDTNRYHFRMKCEELCAEYQQYSIVWIEGQTEFVLPRH
jgi:hypothetical protein